MPAAKNPAQDLVDNEFPAQARLLVPAALKRAYGAVDKLMEDVEWLGTPSGRFQRGDLIVKATEFQFNRLATSGSLPFEPCWEQYAAPTGKHLVMRSERARVTISQVPDPRRKPRPAVFRTNYGVANMEFLFPELNDEARHENELKHIVLLHGYQNLDFACIAVPDPSAERFVWQTDNLMELPHEAVFDERAGPEEGPRDSPDPEAVEDLHRVIRDNE